MDQQQASRLPRTNPALQISASSSSAASDWQPIASLHALCRRCPSRCHGDDAIHLLESRKTASQPSIESQPLSTIETSLPFDLTAVDRAIANTRFAGYLFHFASIPSTQTLALQAANSGAQHGVWIADQQTAGRGRGGHTWHSAPNDGLYLTALVTPDLPLHTAMRLSLLTALAVQAAITGITGFRAPDEIDIRWPNDLLLHTRKVGGILIESAAAPALAGRPPMLRYAVIGVGINCNQLTFPPDLDHLATSLRRESPAPAPPIAREALLAAFLRHLDTEIRSLTHPTNAPPRDLTRHSTWLTGKRVTVPEDGGYTGITAGLNPDGFLLVQANDGILRTVRSGGVREALTKT